MTLHPSPFTKAKTVPHAVKATLAPTALPAETNHTETMATGTSVPKSPAVLDTAMAMAALSPADAALYRDIFAAQKNNKFGDADALIRQLGNRRLMGFVLADRYENHKPAVADLAAWLRDYADLPEANAIYASARHLNKGGKLLLRPPSGATAWSGGSEVDSAADFAALINIDNIPTGHTQQLAHMINAALRSGNPENARNFLIKAASVHPLVGTFSADANAAIAAGFFYSGEREQARALANAAAAANQPLGLWIYGLIAWERKDYSTAATTFIRLADHPALTLGSRAAAHFWAYRSLNRASKAHEAQAQLILAAHSPHSFYGLLANEQLTPVHPAKQESIELPLWTKTERDVIAAQNLGWRALALIQVGEIQRAEDVLRHLNPQGQPELQRAMLALAGYVPLPALAIQLATLVNPAAGQRYEAALYPIPPWQPPEGFAIDRALIYALMRHESSFNPSAVSPAGASGLMQLMPATVNSMAAADSEKAVFSDDVKLFDPTFNVALGQRYVQRLAEQPQIGDNLVLFLAAYNGGPNNVSHWLENKNALRDPLLFMESIPFRETRNYITRVLPHYWAYRARLNESQNSLHQLAEGVWPQLSLRGESAIREAGALEKQNHKLPLRLASE